MIQEKIREVRGKIDAACHRSGRDPAEVALVAVAKGQPAERVAEAVRAGIRDIGENYAQEMMGHVGTLLATPLQPRWHFIGHLQRNKVRQIIDSVALIHTVDSIELAREIEHRAAQQQKVQPVLIEVKLAAERSKTGLSPEQAEALVTSLAPLSHLELRGFMAIPPPSDDPRPFFRELREIRDAINRKNLYKTPLTELSIGMTSDFEVAIEEGATIVRVGTGIFGPGK